MKWDLHYQDVRTKAPLVWPDINVVRLVSKSSLTKQARVLDLGCGEGRNTRALHELGFGDITAIDQSPNALKLVHNLYGIATERLICTDIAAGLPMLKSNHFDLVVCWGLMHYLTKPENTLKEINRVLSDNASIVISFSSNDDKRETVDAVRNYFTQQQVESLMVASGFEITSIGKVTDQFISDNKTESYYWLRAVKST
ncbi:methyltransferase domain-containing protein [Shewanella sp. Scap07]|uniref:class I SAM-dependent methyltransferase n=1 Tax=Shewanella sp. Scap07 TaxID=2589987 RepID=UPI0015BDF8E4|nr:class I SAM-dependent methyltransferase [Shewanella sp. Scap07]QLE86195.1 methyltransferase domain-containing protein [Shewanella sp. Scap07]